MYHLFCQKINDYLLNIQNAKNLFLYSDSHKYKELVPAICKNSLKHILLQLKNTTRRGLSKFLWLKSGYYVLNSHKSKINF